MPDLEFFTVVSSGLHSIGVDYVDPGTDPDEEIIYSFVDFVPREPGGTVHWLSGPPRPAASSWTPSAAAIPPRTASCARSSATRKTRSSSSPRPPTRSP